MLSICCCADDPTVVFPLSYACQMYTENRRVFLWRSCYKHKSILYTKIKKIKNKPSIMLCRLLYNNNNDNKIVSYMRNTMEKNLNNFVVASFFSRSSFVMLYFGLIVKPLFAVMSEGDVIHNTKEYGKKRMHCQKSFGFMQKGSIEMMRWFQFNQRNYISSRLPYSIGINK